jgi:beta-glucanase (GH16 family)
MFVWRMPTDRSRRARAAEVTIAAILLVLPMQTLAATNYQVAAPMPVPSTRPSWTDEFAGKTIDRSKWRFDTANNKTGWFNHERQYYAADRPENARIEGGALVIEARRESLQDKLDWGGQTYTSAKLVSRVSHAYGFYEIRAMLPCARGTWPALWLLPRTGKWPDAGEIDVMEMVGWQPNAPHRCVQSRQGDPAGRPDRGTDGVYRLSPLSTRLAPRLDHHRR